MSISSTYVSRRLTVISGISGAIIARVASSASAVASRGHTAVMAAAATGAATGSLSDNGWEIESGSDVGGSIWTRPIPGTDGQFQIRLGDVEVVLLRVARRFHYEVQELRAGDVTGFKIVPGSLIGPETNHGSGTAIDILPGGLPDGVRGSLTSDQVDNVRNILEDLDGVVSWGGDFEVPTQTHFEISVQPGESSLIALAGRIRIEDELLGSQVGVTF